MSNLTARWQRPELTSWPTFGRLFGLRDELDRLFEASFGDATSAPRFRGVWSPTVDVFEDKDKVIVKAELPGMKREDIEVSLHDGVLSISGERKSGKDFDEARMHRTERFVGRFQRTFTLPARVDAAKVGALYQDGVLTVTLPKVEEAKPKRIEVKVN